MILEVDTSIIRGIPKITQDPTKEDIHNIVGSLHWDDISWAILKIDEKNRIECSGSYNDGFAIIYQEGESDYIGFDSPTSVDEIIDILTRYLNNDNSWKDMFAWEYFTKGPNGRPVKRGLISGFLGKPNSEKAPYIISLIILIAIYIIGNYLNE